MKSFFCGAKWRNIWSNVILSNKRKIELCDRNCYNTAFVWIFVDKIRKSGDIDVLIRIEMPRIPIEEWLLNCDCKEGAEYVKKMVLLSRLAISLLHNINGCLKRSILVKIH